MANFPVVAQSSKKRYKQTTLSFPMKKAVSQIAKAVVNKQAETKSAIASIGNFTFDDLVYAQNLHAFVVQGDTNQTRTGTKIHIKNFYMRFKIQHYNSLAVGQGTSSTRLMIIRTDQPLTATINSITVTDVFRGTAAYRATNGLPDLNKVSVLYDKTFTTNTSTNNYTNMHTMAKINLKIDKTVTYQTDTSNYIKDGNYYLIFTGMKTDGTAANMGQINGQWAVNFKDL